MEDNVEPNWLMHHRQSSGWHGQMSRALSRDAIGWQRENLGYWPHFLCSKDGAEPLRTMWGHAWGRGGGYFHFALALSLWFLNVFNTSLLDLHFIQKRRAGRALGPVEHAKNSYAVGSIRRNGGTHRPRTAGRCNAERRGIFKGARLLSRFPLNFLL